MTPARHNALVSVLTERLSVVQLSEAQMAALAADVDAETADAIRYLLAHPAGPGSPWTAFYAVSRRVDGVRVGLICFKGAPDRHGRVEIGYGTHEPFRGQGYMTEAVAALCRYVLTHTDIAGIEAETLHTNAASQQVVARCGMRPFKSTPESLWWRIDKEG